MCSQDPIFGTNKNRILKNGSCERASRRVLFVVPAGVAKNPKIQCISMKLLTQSAIIATCQKRIDFFLLKVSPT